MRDRVVIYLFFLIFCISTVHAETSFFSTGRSYAIGGTVLLTTAIPSEQLISGALSNQNKVLVTDFGYQQKYGLKELDIVYSAFSYRLNSYSFVAGVSQLGDPDLYTQKKGRIGLLYSKSFFTVGNFITSETHDFNNHYEAVSQFSYALSLQIKNKAFIINSIVDYLNKPSFTKNSPNSEPKLTIFGELLGLQKHKTTLMFSTQKDEKNKFGIGQTIEVSQAASFMFGYSTAPTQFGGGITMKWKNHSVLYSSSFHPVLGLTHSVGFVIFIIDN